MISPYVTHRLPEFWPDPERFDPDRFALDRIQERPRFACVPFAAGPCLCMGRNFAVMEGVFRFASAGSIPVLTQVRAPIRNFPPARDEPPTRYRLEDASSRVAR